MKKIFAVLSFVLIFASASKAFPCSCDGQLLGDPGFELSTYDGTFPDSICSPSHPNDPDPGCWHPCTSGGQAGAVCTTTAAHSGYNGLWEYTGNGTPGWWSGPYQEFEANPGEVYCAHAWIRSATPPG